MAILSRSSFVLNTSLIVEPGTLGGFPGGGGITRALDHLLDPHVVPPEYPVWTLVNGSLGTGVPSYNVNGPGAANYRYYLFTITTSADNVDEVQQVSDVTFAESLALNLSFSAPFSRRIGLQCRSGTG